MEGEEPISFDVDNSPIRARVDDIFSDKSNGEESAHEEEAQEEKADSNKEESGDLAEEEDHRDQAVEERNPSKWKVRLSHQVSVF